MNEGKKLKRKEKQTIYILDEEKLNMMSRKERREYIKEHKKGNQKLKF